MYHGFLQPFDQALPEAEASSALWLLCLAPGCFPLKQAGVEVAWMRLLGALGISPRGILQPSKCSLSPSEWSRAGLLLSPFKAPAVRRLAVSIGCFHQGLMVPSTSADLVHQPRSSTYPEQILQLSPFKNILPWPGLPC